MRNPNYKYIQTVDNGLGTAEGWKIIHADGTVVWGKTKAAARSRLLRVTRRNQRLGITPIQTQAEGETNDQTKA